MNRYYDGPAYPEILFVGDFPNHDEQKSGKVFSNKAGAELKRAINQAGLNQFKHGYTYSILQTPPENKPDNICVKKADVPKDYPFAAYGQGKYIPLEIAAAGFYNLDKIVKEHKPKLIVALGNMACWLTMDSGKIGQIRGSVFTDTKFNTPCLATHSFGQIMKEWSLRPIAIADFGKAKRFIEGNYHQPERRLLIEPTMDELIHWVNTHIWDKADEITELSFDIETSKKQITCIGFAPTGYDAICIPFFDPDAVSRGKNYWPTLEQERFVYKLVKKILESPIPKLAQNGMYDVQYLRKYGISPRNFTHDTMVRHHSIFPEMQKGLGFLATIYTDEAPWKMMRNRNRDQLKLED